MVRGNLFHDAVPPVDGERIETLLEHRQLVIERIVSSARVQPAEYVQAQDEWVVILQGSAVLDIDGRETRMMTGDHVFLPAGTPHTVVATSEGTIWLAVHLHPDAPSPARLRSPTQEAT